MDFKNLIFIVMIICASQSYAQDKEHYDFGFSPGLILQNDLFGEANLIIGKVINEKMVAGFSGARIGFETNFKDGNDFTIAPKIGYESSVTIVVIRLSAVNYFNNGNSEFRIIPEVGFTFGGFVNLTYGYGIRFQKSEVNNVSQHRLSLTFNLNKKILKESLPRM